MRMYVAAGAILTVVILGGCASVPSLKPIPSTEISEVITQIKKDIGYYNSQVGFRPPIRTTCTMGRPDDFNFKITQVDLSLTAEVANSGDGQVGASVPAPTSFLTKVGLALGLTQEKADSELIDLTLVPEETSIPDEKDHPSMGKPGDTPITDTLFALTNGIAEASNHYPCFKIPSTSGDGQGKPASPGKESKIKDTVTFALKGVTRKKGGVNLTLGVVGISASNEIKSMTGHTIVVTIEPRAKPGIETMNLKSTME